MIEIWYALTIVIGGAVAFLMFILPRLEARISELEDSINQLLDIAGEVDNEEVPS